MGNYYIYSLWNINIIPSNLRKIYENLQFYYLFNIFYTYNSITIVYCKLLRLWRSLIFSRVAFVYNYILNYSFKCFRISFYAIEKVFMILHNSWHILYIFIYLHIYTMDTLDYKIISYTFIFGSLINCSWDLNLYFFGTWDYD